MLSSNLSLPPAFGQAYVGEPFSCSLCANNELSESNRSRVVTGVRLAAEMQTPSQTVPLPLFPEEDSDGTDMKEVLPGTSLQRIIRFDLKEEGNHVLIVNVNYSETSQAEGTSAATGGRVRTFRKLYQFQAQPCLSIRTKATELPATEVPDKTLGPYGRVAMLRFALEAQLENVSDGSLVLEQASLLPYPPLKAKSLNWDLNSVAEDSPLLNPRDVLQLAFLVEQDPTVSAGVEELKANLRRDGRTILGQISISWRSGMGEKGHLTTGNLLTRKR